MRTGVVLRAPPQQLCVVGAGRWGTALSIALSSRFEGVSLWTREGANAAAMNATRENLRYLPGIPLPPNVRISAVGEICLQNADFVISVVPSSFLRSTLRTLQAHLPPHARFVSATKGIEEGSLLRMSVVAREALGWNPDRPI